MTTDDILQTLHPKKSYKKLLFLWCMGIFIIVLIAGGIYYWNHKEPTITYQTQEAFLGDISSTINANGTLSPTNKISIGSVISGIILEVLVDVNDEVKKGQILARINPESIEQNLRRFQAQLESAKAQLKASQVTLEEKQWQYQQLQNLYEKTQGQIPSALELQNAKTLYNTALSDIAIKKAAIKEIEASIGSAKIDLKNSNIISPIKGIILQRSVEAGQSVAASFQAPELFIVAESLEEMELNANISEADIGKVRVGQKVSFSVDSYPNRLFEAAINRINYSSSTNTSNGVVSYEVKIYVSNKDLLLRPGMSATADIEVANAKDALLVPSSALYFNPQQPSTKEKTSFNPFSQPPPNFRKKPSQNPKRNSTQTIWILEENKPRKIEVTLGVSNNEFTQISSPEIEPNTQVIIGQQSH